MLEKYTVVVQASPEEILQLSSIEDSVLQALKNWPSIKDIIVAMPMLEYVKEAEKKIEQWGIKCFIGSTYNVCDRIVNAYRLMTDQSFAVRVLASWKHVDLEYIDMLVETMQKGKYDLIIPPLDFDITLSADVASLDAIETIGKLAGKTQEIGRAKFNPWGYMEIHPEQFFIKYMDYAPMFDKDRIQSILSDKKMHPENEFFGREYSGSRYHFIYNFIPKNTKILDIACGSGQGSDLLSQKADLVVGVDYLDRYIEKAKARYKGNKKLIFKRGDGENFLYNDKLEQFDVIVSLHTLEHVKNDYKMLINLFRNLKKGGKLILEVPLLRNRPLGVPINPYHFREYKKEQIIDMVEKIGFKIIKTIGSTRSFYINDVNQARDAIQIHAIKV